MATTVMPVSTTLSLASPAVAPRRPAQEQLDIHAQQQKPAYHQAMARIMELRERYIKERWAFIEGAEMISLLTKLGATAEDIEGMKTVSDNLYDDPTLPFRRSRNGRFCMDMEKKTLQRLAFQPFALSAEEDFKRYDSGQVRVFDEIEDNLQLNTALQALMVFKAAIIHGVDIARRPLLNYDAKQWVCTLFNVRTFTNKDVLGEPALEGVHSDGVDHTMTTYLGSNNMTPSSAVTYMHEMAETTGIQIHETKTHLVRARAHHRHFLDSLIFVDHEYKHSLTPVYAQDPAKEATRDMLVFFTRRPVCEGHISSAIDSLTQHERLRMEFPIFAPTL